MRQNFSLNKKRREEAKKKKREEKRIKRLNQRAEDPSSAPAIPTEETPPTPDLP